jgi:uncharacterized protein (TIGR00369 family)
MDAATFERFRNDNWNTPFHKLIGLELMSANESEIVARLVRKPDLKGRNSHDIMHGGVVATMLDSACGYLAAIAVRHKLRDAPEEEMWRRVGRVVTLDMHVDYLRPPTDAEFEVKSTVIHAGSNVIRARGQITGAEGKLISTASANFTY